jgi:hypothetical protein
MVRDEVVWLSLGTSLLFREALFENGYYSMLGFEDVSRDLERGDNAHLQISPTLDRTHLPKSVEHDRSLFFMKHISALAERDQFLPKTFEERRALLDSAAHVLQRDILKRCLTHSDDKDETSHSQQNHQHAFSAAERVHFRRITVMRKHYGIFLLAKQRVRKSVRLEVFKRTAADGELVPTARFATVLADVLLKSVSEHAPASMVAELLDSMDKFMEGQSILSLRGPSPVDATLTAFDVWLKQCMVNHPERALTSFLSSALLRGSVASLMHAAFVLLSAHDSPVRLNNLINDFLSLSPSPTVELFQQSHFRWNWKVFPMTALPEAPSTLDVLCTSIASSGKCLYFLSREYGFEVLPFNELDRANVPVYTRPVSTLVEDGVFPPASEAAPRTVLLFAQQKLYVYRMGECFELDDEGAVRGRWHLSHSQATFRSGDLVVTDGRYIYVIGSSSSNSSEESTTAEVRVFDPSRRGAFVFALNLDLSNVTLSHSAAFNNTVALKLADVMSCVCTGTHLLFVADVSRKSRSEFITFDMHTGQQCKTPSYGIFDDNMYTYDAENNLLFGFSFRTRRLWEWLNSLAPGNGSEHWPHQRCSIDGSFHVCPYGRIDVQRVLGSAPQVGDTVDPKRLALLLLAQMERLGVMASSTSSGLAIHCVTEETLKADRERTGTLPDEIAFVVDPDPETFSSIVNVMKQLTDMLVSKCESPGVVDATISALFLLKVNLSFVFRHGILDADVLDTARSCEIARLCARLYWDVFPDLRLTESEKCRIGESYLADIMATFPALFACWTDDGRGLLSRLVSEPRHVPLLRKFLVQVERRPHLLNLAIPDPLSMQLVLSEVLGHMLHEDSFYLENSRDVKVTDTPRKSKPELAMFARMLVRDIIGSHSSPELIDACIQMVFKFATEFIRVYRSGSQSSKRVAYCLLPDTVSFVCWSAEACSLRIDSGFISSFIDELLSVFDLAALDSDDGDLDCRLEPKIAESAHPYGSSSRSSETLTFAFPGAEAVHIYFDPRCRTKGADKLEILAGSADGPLFRGFSGSDFPSGLQNPLSILHNTVSLKFKWDASSTSDWGYRIILCPTVSVSEIMKRNARFASMLAERDHEWAYACILSGISMCVNHSAEILRLPYSLDALPPSLAQSLIRGVLAIRRHDTFDAVASIPELIYQVLVRRYALPSEPQDVLHAVVEAGMQCLFRLFMVPASAVSQWADAVAASPDTDALMLSNFSPSLLSAIDLLFREIDTSLRSDTFSSDWRSCVDKAVLVGKYFETGMVFSPASDTPLSEEFQWWKASVGSPPRHKGAASLKDFQPTHLLQPVFAWMMDLSTPIINNISSCLSGFSDHCLQLMKMYDGFSSLMKVVHKSQSTMSSFLSKVCESVAQHNDVASRMQKHVSASFDRFLRTFTDDSQYFISDSYISRMLVLLLSVDKPLLMSPFFLERQRTMQILSQQPAGLPAVLLHITMTASVLFTDIPPILGVKLYQLLDESMRKMFLDLQNESFSEAHRFETLSLAYVLLVCCGSAVVEQSSASSLSLILAAVDTRLYSSLRAKRLAVRVLKHYLKETLPESVFPNASSSLFARTSNSSARSDSEVFVSRMLQRIGGAYLNCSVPPSTAYAYDEESIEKFSAALSKSSNEPLPPSAKARPVLPERNLAHARHITDVSIDYRTVSSDFFTFDITEDVCRPFGFFHGERVQTPNGPATVIGVRSNNLWFHVDSDEGASYWGSCRTEADHLSHGFARIGAAIIPKASHNVLVGVKQSLSAVHFTSEDDQAIAREMSTCLLALAGESKWSSIVRDQLWKSFEHLSRAIDSDVDDTELVAAFGALVCLSSASPFAEDVSPMDVGDFVVPKSLYFATRGAVPPTQVCGVVLERSRFCSKMRIVGPPFFDGSSVEEVAVAEYIPVPRDLWNAASLWSSENVLSSMTLAERFVSMLRTGELPGRFSPLRLSLTAYRLIRAVCIAVCGSPRIQSEIAFDGRGQQFLKSALAVGSSQLWTGASASLDELSRVLRDVEPEACSHSSSWRPQPSSTIPATRYAPWRAATVPYPSRCSSESVRSVQFVGPPGTSGFDGRTVEYCAQRHSDNKDAAMVRASAYVPDACPFFYFEAEVQFLAQKGFVGIGLFPAEADALPSGMPGWYHSSYGYHSDDGGLYHLLRAREKWETFGQGDVIGLGWLRDEGCIFLTKNGRNLGIAFRNVRGRFFPVIGMIGFRTRVRLNFGEDPFKYDVLQRGKCDYPFPSPASAPATEFWSVNDERIRSSNAQSTRRQNRQSRNRRAAATTSHVPDNLVSQLTQMGFARPHALRALRMTRNNVEAAIDWIFTNPDGGDDRNDEGRESAQVDEEEEEEDEDEDGNGEEEEEEEDGEDEEEEEEEEEAEEGEEGEVEEGDGDDGDAGEDDQEGGGDENNDVRRLRVRGESTASSQLAHDVEVPPQSEIANFVALAMREHMDREMTAEFTGAKVTPLPPLWQVNGLEVRVGSYFRIVHKTEDSRSKKLLEFLYSVAKGRIGVVRKVDNEMECVVLEFFDRERSLRQCVIVPFAFIERPWDLELGTVDSYSLVSATDSKTVGSTLHQRLESSVSAVGYYALQDLACLLCRELFLHLLRERYETKLCDVGNSGSVRYDALRECLMQDSALRQSFVSVYLPSEIYRIEALPLQSVHSLAALSDIIDLPSYERIVLSPVLKDFVLSLMESNAHRDVVATFSSVAYEVLGNSIRSPFVSIVPAIGAVPDSASEMSASGDVVRLVWLATAILDFHSTHHVAHSEQSLEQMVSLLFRLVLTPFVPMKEHLMVTCAKLLRSRILCGSSVSGLFSVPVASAPSDHVPSAAVVALQKWLHQMWTVEREWKVSSPLVQALSELLLAIDEMSFTSSAVDQNALPPTTLPNAVASVSELSVLSDVLAGNVSRVSSNARLRRFWDENVGILPKQRLVNLTNHPYDKLSSTNVTVANAHGVKLMFDEECAIHYSHQLYVERLADGASEANKVTGSSDIVFSLDGTDDNFPPALELEGSAFRIGVRKNPEHVEEHSMVTCDYDGDPCTGTRYKCVHCSDWDCCDSCEQGCLDNNVHDLRHIFLVLPFDVHGRRVTQYPIPDIPLQVPPVASSSPNAANRDAASASEVLVADLIPGFQQVEVRHEHTVCKYCSMTPIVGVRYYDVNCDVQENADICSRCQAEDRVPLTHALLKIRFPLAGDQPLRFRLPPYYDAGLAWGVRLTVSPQPSNAVESFDQVGYDSFLQAMNLRWQDGLDAMLLQLVRRLMQDERNPDGNLDATSPSPSPPGRRHFRFDEDDSDEEEETRGSSPGSSSATSSEAIDLAMFSPHSLTVTDHIRRQRSDLAPLLVLSPQILQARFVVIKQFNVLVKECLKLLVPCTLSIPLNDSTLEDVAWRQFLAESIPSQRRSSSVAESAVSAAATENIKEYCLQCLTDTVAMRVRALREVVFLSTKEAGYSTEIIKRTAHESDVTTVRLNRHLAIRPTTAERPLDSVFTQAFRRLHRGVMDPSLLRLMRRAFSVVFIGEGADDYGGPYHEALSSMVAELHFPILPELHNRGVFSIDAYLHTATLPLFLPVPNAQHEVAGNRDRFVPLVRSLASQFRHRQLEFVGQLMGIGLRTGAPLAFDLAPLCYRALTPTASSTSLPKVSRDLFAVDASLANAVDGLLRPERHGVSQEDFADAYGMLGFSAAASDGSSWDLCWLGSDRSLDWTERIRYVRRLLEFRMHEFDLALAAIRRGICYMVPHAAAYALWSPSEMETKITGSRDVDVAALRRATRYDMCAETDPHIERFWRVFAAESAEFRAGFLRFVSGRSRLPTTAGSSFTLVIKGFFRGPPEEHDKYLPQSATCFFTIQLPRYSTDEIMRERLWFAIRHCHSIDTDYNVRTDDFGAAQGAAQDGEDEEAEFE